MLKYWTILAILFNILYFCDKTGKDFTVVSHFWVTLQSRKAQYTVGGIKLLQNEGFEKHGY